jgi:hypothetical protein
MSLARIVLVRQLLAGAEQHPLLDLEGAPEFVLGCPTEHTATELVQGLVDPLNDVEAIEHMSRVGQIPGQHGLISKIAHRTANPLASPSANALEERQHPLLALAVADPHHAARLEVGDHREVDAPAGPRHLVDADPPKALECVLAVSQRQLDGSLVHAGGGVPRQTTHLGHRPHRQLRAQRGNPLEEAPRHAKARHRERKPLHPGPPAARNAHGVDLQIGLEVPDRSVTEADRLELLEQPTLDLSAAVRALVPPAPVAHVHDLDPPPRIAEPRRGSNLDRVNREVLKTKVNNEIISRFLAHSSWTSSSLPRRRSNA